MIPDTDYSIRQDNEAILYGDAVSIPMIFNNMTGKNIKDKEEYALYKKFMEEQGFSLQKPFELWDNNGYIKTGNFKS